MIHAKRAGLLTLGALAYPLGYLIGRILHHRNALLPVEPADPTDLGAAGW